MNALPQDQRKQMENAMTSKERVIRAFELGTPDKVPFHAYESPEHAIRQLGREVHEMYLEPDLVPEAMINAAKLYDNDIIYFRPGRRIPDSQEVVETDEGLTIRDKKTKDAVFRVLRDTKELLPATPPGDPLVKTIEDVDEIPVTPHGYVLQHPHMTDWKRYLDEFAEDRFIFGSACAQSANTLDACLGTEAAMVATLTDPGLCRAIMERKYEALKEQILALKLIGVDGVYTGDACASCSFYSPEIYRDLFFEYHKRSIDFVHEQGLKALLHVCGRISPILEDMAATGADVIESLDAFSAGGDIELKDAKQRVGHLVCLKGNIDAVNVIAKLTPEEVYRECTQAMNDAGPDGYVLSTEQITRDTPRESVLAMVQARDDFRI